MGLLGIPRTLTAEPVHHFDKLEHRGTRKVSGLGELHQHFGAVCGAGDWLPPGVGDVVDSVLGVPTTANWP